MGLKDRLAGAPGSVWRALVWLARQPWRVLRAVGRGIRRVLLWVTAPVRWVLAPIWRWLEPILNNADGTPAPPAPTTFLFLGTVTVLLAALSVVATSGVSAPLPPMQPVGRVASVGDAVFDQDRGVLFIRGQGPVWAFEDPSGDTLTWCDRSNQIESDSGRAWGPDGRSLDGGPSLVSYPTQVHDAVLYMDTTTSTDPLPPGPAGTPTLACVEADEGD